MRRSTFSSFALLLLAPLALAVPSPMEAQTLSVGAHAGTQGLGVSLAARLSDQLHVRLSGGQYSVNETVSTDAVDYRGDLSLGSVLALFDWYPAGGSFRVSAGFGWSDNEVQVTAPLEDLLRDEFPDLPPFDFALGTAEGTAKGQDFVPALLLGWGNPLAGGRVGLSLDVGVLYQGEPSVDLEARTTAVVDSIPGAQEILDLLAANQEVALEAELEEYSLIPVIQLGITIRF